MKQFDILLQLLENICGPGMYDDLTKEDHEHFEEICRVTNPNDLKIVENENVCGLKISGEFNGPYWCKVDSDNPYINGWWYNWFDDGYPTRMWSMMTRGTKINGFPYGQWNSVCHDIPTECSDENIKRMYHYNLSGEQDFNGSYIICFDWDGNMIRYIRVNNNETKIYYLDNNGEIMGIKKVTPYLNTYQGFDGVIKRCDDVLDFGLDYFCDSLDWNYSSKICYVCNIRKMHVEKSDVHQAGNVCLECRAKEANYLPNPSRPDAGDVFQAARKYCICSTYSTSSCKIDVRGIHFKEAHHQHDWSAVHPPYSNGVKETDVKALYDVRDYLIDHPDKYLVDSGDSSNRNPCWVNSPSRICLNCMAYGYSVESENGECGKCANCKDQDNFNYKSFLEALEYEKFN